MALPQSEDLYLKQVNVVGVSHKTLPVAQRELLTRLENQNGAFLSSLVAECGLQEVALLSTCNRFEVIAVGNESQTVLKYISSRLENPIDPRSFYVLKNSDAVRHLFRVAASLDSMVVGEAQILGQVKECYERAVAHGCAGRYLHHLFQFTFQLAKKIRANTAIAEKGVSVSYIAVRMAQQIFGTLDQRSVLVIGSGKMAELAAIHLKSYGCNYITVANRTLENAVDLAQRIGGSAISLTEIPHSLDQVDVVIGSLSIDRPLIETSMLKKRQGGKPLFLIDLGVPRNFSASLGEIDDVYLYTIDDLATMAEENKSLREEAAKDAEIIIDYGLFQFERWLMKLSVEPAILDFRLKVKQICETELRRSLGAQFGDKQIEELLPELSHRISQKISHDLTVPGGRLPQAGLDEENLVPIIFDDFLKLL